MLKTPHNHFSNSTFSLIPQKPNHFSNLSYFSPMAKSFTILLLLSLLLISTAPSSSSARLLNNHFFTLTAGAATEPIFNLALPTDNNVDGAAALKETGHVSPCHMDAPGELPSSERRFRATPRLAGKYGPLVLNMLPKGTVPPSGPSKGSNSINN